MNIAAFEVRTHALDRLEAFTFAGNKDLLREATERTVDGLWSAIGRIVDLYSPAECANYFSACGYDLDW